MTEDFEGTRKEGSVSKKIITIRGIDTDVYNKFAQKIKALSLNIGEAVTKMMIGVLDNSDKDLGESASIALRADLDTISVTEQSELIVSNQDLLEIDNRYVFMNINYLKFDSDVDPETFMSKIAAIRSCQKVIIPNFLPRLKLLSKIKFCTDVELYEVSKRDRK